MHPQLTVELAKDRIDSMHREAEEVGRHRRARAARRARRRLRHGPVTNPRPGRRGR